mgnify:CR=1 FL=1
MKTLSRIVIVAFLMLFPAVMNAQVLISLVFGKALNTDKVEFGLAGGMSRSYINSIPESDPMNSFDLGFYFHILMKNSSYLSTGVHVKSNVGATGMPTYPLEGEGSEYFNALYKDGTLTKKIPSFYVPILFHQRFNNRWYLEAGPQLGLNYKETDVFTENVLDGDMTFNRNVVDEYKRIDAGLLGGIGYKLKKQIKSTAIGINYYYGLVDVSKNPSYEIRNSAIYFYVKIPIGVAPKEEKKN